MLLTNYPGFGHMNTQLLVITAWRSIWTLKNQELCVLLGYQPVGILHILKFSSDSMEENVSVLKIYVSNL